MTFENSYNTIDEIQISLLEKLFLNGQYVETRGLKTLELCNVNLCLLNPRNRITYNTSRKWKLSLAIGEFAWHISASNDLDFITYYARQWSNFSSDGISIKQSCYGHKIFKEDIYGESQWNRLIKLLKKDPFSRRAVLDLYDSDNGIDYFVTDIACACTVQFLVRQNQLDIIVNMRSNDIIWGLPYDIYFFTMLQELLSLQLGVEMGRYYHNVGSLHIYEQHFELGRKMKTERPELINPIDMDNFGDLKVFLEYEREIRKSHVSIEDVLHLSISQYWKELLLHLVEFKKRKARTANRSIAKSGADIT